MLLQETFWSHDLQRNICNEWTGTCLFNNGTNQSKGVAILINRDPKIDLIRAFNKSDGRIVAARLSINRICYFVLNVYAPTNKLQKEPFYKMLLNWLNTVKEDNDILIA